MLKDVKLKTPKTVDHLAINCPFHNRLNIIADVVMCYAGMTKYCIIFCDTKKEANNILLNAEIKQSC
jgi:ATP-dependent RNA helicase DDX21